MLKKSSIIVLTILSGSYSSNALALPDNTTLVMDYYMGKKDGGEFLRYQDKLYILNNTLKIERYKNQVKDGKKSSGLPLISIYDKNTKNFYLFSEETNKKDKFYSLYPKTNPQDFVLTKIFPIELIPQDIYDLKNFEKYLIKEGYTVTKTEKVNNYDSEVWTCTKTMDGVSDKTLKGYLNTKKIWVAKALKFPIKFYSSYIDPKTKKEKFINKYEAKSIKEKAGLVKTDLAVPKDYKELKPIKYRPFKELLLRNK